MLTSETIVDIPLGDVTPTSTQADAMVTALETQYAVSGAAVTVTLKQKLSVDAAVSTSLDATTQCTILIDVLTATSLGATCVATAGATYTTFELTYPITGTGVDTTAVNSKTAAIEAQVVAAAFPGEMSSAAASYRRRRLADLTVSDVQTPVAALEAEVSIVASAADSSTLATITSASEIVVNDNDVAAIGAALAGTGVSGLNVQDPVISTILTNAPPSPPPLPSPPPPPPSPPPPSPDGDAPLVSEVVAVVTVDTTCDQGDSASAAVCGALNAITSEAVFDCGFACGSVVVTGTASGLSDAVKALVTSAIDVGLSSPEAASDFLNVNVVSVSYSVVVVVAAPPSAPATADDIGLVAGAAVGAIVVVALIILVVVMMMKKKKKSRGNVAPQ